MTRQSDFDRLPTLTVPPRVLAGFALLVMLVVSAVAGAQDSDESCREILQAVVDAELINNSVGEGTEFDRSTMEMQAEPGGFQGTISFFASEELVRLKIIHYLCDGRRFLIRDSLIRSMTGVGERHMAYDPPMVAMVLPLTEGEGWQWSGTMIVTAPDGGQDWPATQSGVVVDTETLDTPAGTFETLQVHYEMTITTDVGDVSLHHDSWYRTSPTLLEIRSSTTDGERTETWISDRITSIQ